jgi:hypothetical protein
MTEVIQYKVIHTNSAKSFLDILTDSRWVSDDGWSSPWVFRGQGDSEYRLTPRAWRNTARQECSAVINSLEAILNQHTAQFGTYEEFQSHSGLGIWLNLSEPNRGILLQVCLELALLAEFASVADLIGLHVPRNSARTHLRDLLRWPDPTIPPNVILELTSELASMAQHYGMPTRLLDFTRSSLTAAHFAAKQSAESAGNQIAVWAVNVHKLVMQKVGDPKIRVVSFPRYRNRFLHSQDGLFLCSIWAEQHYSSSYTWPFLDEEIPQDRICKVTLPKPEVSELVRLLWTRHVSEAHLMPTYEHVTRTIFDLWSAGRTPDF